MLKLLAAAAILAATAAPAQTTQYETREESPTRTEPDKIVCKRVEKIGTRLGATKTCLTVREWEARAATDRNDTERIQAGAEICPNGGRC